MKKELRYYEKELEDIYKNTTKAFRQRAGMQRRIAFICDKITELKSKIENENK